MKLWRTRLCEGSPRHVISLFFPSKSQMSKTLLTGLMLTPKQGMAAIELLFAAAVYLLKFSKLALFRELFCHTSAPAKRVLTFLSYLTVVCATASVTGTLYIVLPADPALDHSANSRQTADRAHKDSVNGMVNFACDAVLDIAIFLVPIWQLFPLRLACRRKGAIILAFGLGFL